VKQKKNGGRKLRGRKSKKDTSEEKAPLIDIRDIGAPEWSSYPREEWPASPAEESFRWPTDLDSFAAEKFNLSLGASIFMHLLHVRKWVHRRVERIEIVGTSSVRRRVSVDFEIAEQDTKDILVPLAVLLKEELVDFTITDEGGRSVPVLNRYQNQYVALCMLVAVARTVLQDEVPLDIMYRLARLTYGTISDGEDAYKDLVALDTEESRKLVRNSVFCNLLLTLQRKYLLLVLLPKSSDSRRVLRFSYVQSLIRRLTTVDRIGWRPTDMHLDIPAVDEGGSYHCELELPQGLELAPFRPLDKGKSRSAGEHARVWKKIKDRPESDDPSPPSRALLKQKDEKVSIRTSSNQNPTPMEKKLFLVE
jgi:hypothetical protein